MLNLAEELLLLALEDEKGVVHASASESLDYGLAGAILLSLTVRDRLGMEGGKIIVSNPSPTGDGVLDDALERIRESRPRNPDHWVGRFGRMGLKNQLLDRLVDSGALRREEHKVLWFIPVDRYPAADAGPEREVRRKVRAAALGGEAPDPRSAALLSLIQACNLVDEVFAPDEGAKVWQTLDEISEGGLIGRVVSDAVTQVQTATQAAVMTSVLAATTASAAACSTTSTSC